MDNREAMKFIESKGFNKSLWNKSGKAMHKYNMIEAGDRIAVGISGGKDSLTLFNLLLKIKFIVNFDFEILPVYVSHTEELRPEMEASLKYVERFGYKVTVLPTNIDKIVFEDRNEKNPCALCSRLRRGIIYNYMKENQCNKLALGHHLDDLIETFLMNLFYQGNMKQMLPAYTSEDYGYRIIRPLAFVEEETIVKYSRKLEMPVTHCGCKLYTVKTDPKRLETKVLIKNMAKKNPNIRKSMLHALLSE